MRDEKINELVSLLRTALVLADELELQTVGIRVAETLDLLPRQEWDERTTQADHAGDGEPPRLTLCQDERRSVHDR